MDRQNPFSNFGTTISGERFIGRDEEIRQIHSRMFGEGGYGSLSVLGLPRIGKTSLLAEAVRKAEPRLRRIRAVVVRIDVGVYRSVDELFRSLVLDILEELQVQGWSNEQIQLRVERLIDRPETSFPFVREFFRQLRNSDVRAVCVLDEFDAGRYLFAGSPQCFHWLRELCSNPEFKAAFALISKRPLQDVALIAGHESNYWANVLMPMTLRPFSQEEADLFFKRMEAVGVVVDPDAVQEITGLCGHHPFLLDAFAYHAWQTASLGYCLEVDWVRRTMKSIVRDYYHQVVTVLKDVGMLEKLVQVLVGPQWDILPGDVDAMIEYGVICAGNTQRLHSFSEGFADYLGFVEGCTNLWPLWCDTERLLRDAIATLLQERFGEDWKEEIKKSRPKLRGLIEGCEAKLAKEKARFGERAASSVLAYTYPMDLFQIMAADWPALAEPLLGSDKQGWSVKFSVLAKVRTPLAHNRDEAVTEAERIQAEGICREIISRIRTCHVGKGGTPLKN